MFPIAPAICPCGLVRLSRAFSETGFHEPRDIFSEDVHFEIHGIARFAFAQCGDLPRMRNNPDREMIAAKVGDREADAVEGDRALRNDQRHERGIGGDFQEVIAPGGLSTRDATDAINVASDEMPIEPASDREGAFQVYKGTGPDELKIGAVPGFMQQIEVDRGCRFFSNDLHGRETATVHGDAISDAETPGGGGSANDESNALTGVLDRFDRSSFFDDASEHPDYCGAISFTRKAGREPGRPLESLY